KGGACVGIDQVTSFDNFFKIMPNRLISMQSNLLIPNVGTEVLQERIIQIASTMNSVFAQSDYQQITANLSKTLSLFTSELTRITLGTYPTAVASEILPRIQRAIDLSSPYINEGMLSEAEKETLDDLPHKRLSLSDALALISILITILFGVMSSMPDEQLERISKQNEVIIEQNEKMIEMMQEDQHLVKAVDALANSIYLLTDEVEALRNEAECPLQPPDTEIQDSAADCQRNNTDGQE
ncbi:MAG: hypothetical protein AAGU32_04820, partial [Bacillota bacterium]